MPTHLKRVSTIGVILIALSSINGCKVNEGNVHEWKGTVKGPSKMVAVLLADRYPLSLRTKAALALVEMERKDVDGIEELTKALDKVDQETRKQVIAGMAPGLIEQMQKVGEEPKEGEEKKSASPSQIRAKDAAFVMTKKASGETKDTLTKAVIDWFAVDFNGRSLAGNFSAEQVIRELGSSAASQLVAALDSKMPPQALIKLAQLINETGDDATKKIAGDKIVAIELEMESEPFFNWLKNQIKEQAEAKGEKAEEKDLLRGAVHHRENFITTGALPSMKFLADQTDVAKRLLAIASTPSTDGIILARRTMALLALEGKAKTEHHDQLLELALDSKNPPQIRDNAFDRLGDIRSPKTIARLWPLVQSAANQRERWRAGELVLAIGGSKVLNEFLRRLPSGAEYEPEELEGYATRIGQMTPAPRDEMSALLRVSEWYKRVIALKYFERKGTAADVASMAALKSDSASVSGKHWEPNTKISTIADGAIKGLKQRLDEPKKAS